MGLLFSPNILILHMLILKKQVAFLVPNIFFFLNSGSSITVDILDLFIPRSIPIVSWDIDTWRIHANWSINTPY